VAFRLFSRRFESSLHDLFNDLAQVLVAGGEIHSRTLGQPPRDRARSAPRLHELASDSAQLSHRIANRLADSLITPFEADALHDLALTMSDLMYTLERTAELSATRGAAVVPDTLLEAAQLIERGCELTVEAVWKLQAVKELEGYAQEMRRLRRHGDGLALRARTEVYAHGGAAADLLRERDQIESVEASLRLLDELGRTADLLRVKAP
jgi:uncharacterized protein Yka (UPF0111/DUF47 family)